MVGIVMTARADTLELPFVDLTSREFDADPAAVFARARRRSWLARTSEGFAVLGHAQARAVFRHPALHFAFVHVDPESSPYLHEKTGRHIQALHGSEHARLRRVALDALRERVVERLRVPMREIVSGLVDRVIDRGECDIVRDITDPYPTPVVAPILGVPESDCDRIDAWSSDLLLIFDSARFETLSGWVETAWREIEAYLADLLAERRRLPGDDIYSELVRTEAAGTIDEEEVVTLAIAMTQAALDTTRGQLGFTMECLVRDPTQWERLVEDPGLAESAVEEGLRYAPAVGSIPHVAVDDADIDGVLFPAGSVVAVHPRAVNRIPPPSTTPTASTSRASRVSTSRSASERTPASAPSWRASRWPRRCACSPAASHRGSSRARCGTSRCRRTGTGCRYRFASALSPTPERGARRAAAGRPSRRSARTRPRRRHPGTSQRLLGRARPRGSRSRSARGRAPGEGARPARARYVAQISPL